MQNQTPFVQSGRFSNRPRRDSATRIVIDENELATRRELSVKTLRRWRQKSLGPVFCKLVTRVTYLIPFTVTIPPEFADVVAMDGLRIAAEVIVDQMLQPGQFGVDGGGAGEVGAEGGLLGVPRGFRDVTDDNTVNALID